MRALQQSTLTSDTPDVTRCRPIVAGLVLLGSLGHLAPAHARRSSPTASHTETLPLRSDTWSCAHWDSAQRVCERSVHLLPSARLGDAAQIALSISYGPGLAAHPGALRLEVDGQPLEPKALDEEPQVSSTLLWDVPEGLWKDRRAHLVVHWHPRGLEGGCGASDSRTIRLLDDTALRYTTADDAAPAHLSDALVAFSSHTATQKVAHVPATPDAVAEGLRGVVMPSKPSLIDAEIALQWAAWLGSQSDLLPASIRGARGAAKAGWKVVRGEQVASVQSWPDPTLVVGGLDGLELPSPLAEVIATWQPRNIQAGDAVSAWAPPVAGERPGVAFAVGGAGKGARRAMDTWLGVPAHDRESPRVRPAGDRPPPPSPGPAWGEDRTLLAHWGFGEITHRGADSVRRVLALPSPNNGRLLQGDRLVLHTAASTSPAGQTSVRVSLDGIALGEWSAAFGEGQHAFREVVITEEVAHAIASRADRPIELQFDVQHRLDASIRPCDRVAERAWTTIFPDSYFQRGKRDPDKHGWDSFPAGLRRAAEPPIVVLASPDGRIGPLLGVAELLGAFAPARAPRLSLRVASTLAAGSATAPVLWIGARGEAWTASGFPPLTSSAAWVKQDISGRPLVAWLGVTPADALELMRAVSIGAASRSNHGEAPFSERQSAAGGDKSGDGGKSGDGDGSGDASGDDAVAALQAKLEAIRGYEPYVLAAVFAFMGLWYVSSRRSRIRVASLEKHRRETAARLALSRPKTPDDEEENDEDPDEDEPMTLPPATRS